MTHHFGLPDLGSLAGLVRLSQREKCMLNCILVSTQKEFWWLSDPIPFEDSCCLEILLLCIYLMTDNQTDPICWMQWTIPKHDHRFCSDHCVKVFEAQEWVSSVQDTAPIVEKDNKRVAYVLIWVILVWWILSRRYWVMIQFMWWFFVAVSLLKLLDLKWFVGAYAQYDLIAMKIPSRWWIYPFVELAIWVGFLLHLQVQWIALVTLILMTIWTIWVARKLMKHEQFQCACLGTKLNIPLTNLTLVEDLLMWVMSMMILLWV